VGLLFLYPLFTKNYSDFLGLLQSPIIQFDNAWKNLKLLFNIYFAFN